MKGEFSLTKSVQIRFLVLITMLLITYQADAQRKLISPNRYRFKYRSELYKGTRLQITKQLRTIKNNSKFVGIPEEIQEELNTLFGKTKKQPIPKYYKQHAILFLDALYSYEEFANIYENALYEVVRKVKKDMYVVDFKFERAFTKTKIVLDRVKKEDAGNDKEIERLTKDLYDSETKLLCHRWMKKRFEKYKDIDIIKNPDLLIMEFKKSEAINVFRMYTENNIAAITPYLENQIIDFFYKKSLPEIHPDKLNLKYIDKI